MGYTASVSRKLPELAFMEPSLHISGWELPWNRLGDSWWLEGSRSFFFPLICSWGRGGYLKKKQKQQQRAAHTLAARALPRRGWATRCCWPAAGPCSGARPSPSAPTKKIRRSWGHWRPPPGRWRPEAGRICGTQKSKRGEVGPRNRDGSVFC